MVRSSLDRHMQEPTPSLPPLVPPSTSSPSLGANPAPPGRDPGHGVWLDLAILPDQFAADRHSVVQRTGEYRLLVAILQDACTTWFRYRHARQLREARVFQEVSAWFAEKSSNWPFAFERICDYLGLDPDYIRQGLVQWRPSAPGQRGPQFHMSPSIRNRERVAYDEPSRRLPLD